MMRENGKTGNPISAPKKAVQKGVMFGMKKGKKRSVMVTDGVVSALIHPHPSKTDPQGSWTGLPADENEEPVQDADDL